MEPKIPELRKLTCDHCNYIWYSKSQMYYVSCPRCRMKVKIMEFKDVKGGKKNGRPKQEIRQLG